MQSLLRHGGGPQAQARPQRLFNNDKIRRSKVLSRLPRAGRHSGRKNYYDLLGIEVDTSEEEIKAAFRRRAKELHPDVNSEADAEEAFIQVSTAYETLGDEEKRIAYNRLHGLGGRRLNFFQDVDFESEGQPFSWQRRRWSSAARPDDDSGFLDYEETGGIEDEEFLESTPFGRDFRRRWRQRRSSGFRWSDLGSDDEEWRVGVDADAPEDEDEEGPDAVGDERSAKDIADAEARRLEALLGVLGRMNASGMMTSREWGSGRMDPWGTGTSEAWHRKVEQQKTNPFPGRGMGGSFYPRPSEWTPPGRGDDDLGGGRIGWMPPGRGIGDPQQGGGGGSRRWGGDDGGFSGRPL